MIFVSIVYYNLFLINSYHVKYIIVWLYIVFFCIYIYIRYYYTITVYIIVLLHAVIYFMV